MLKYLLQCKSWFYWLSWFVMSGGRKKIMKWTRTCGKITHFLSALLGHNGHPEVPLCCPIDQAPWLKLKTTLFSNFYHVDVLATPNIKE